MPALSGCSISVCGKFPGYTQAKLKVLITKNGAKFENGISSTCTHLVIPDIVINMNDKVNAALAKKIPIVKLEWLTDSVKEGKKLAEEQYLHNDGGVSNGEPVRSDPKKRKGDGSEEPIANTIKKPRARGQKTDAKAKSPVDQDVVMDEPAEGAGMEKKPKRRDGLKTEAAPEPVKFELNKKGSAADQVIESRPTVQNLEIKETEPVEPAKKKQKAYQKRGATRT